MAQVMGQDKNYDGRLCRGYALARHTSWRIGGLADYCYFPSDLGDLSNCLKAEIFPKPYCWLGLGSNVLIRDGGIRGTVIITLGGLQAMALESSGRAYVQAGVTCAKFARFCAGHGLTKAAFFAGVPGTMGGALAMNAGAFGGQAWEHVVALEMINGCGERRIYDPSDFKVGYRDVDFHNFGWFVGAWFDLPSGDSSEEKLAIKALLRKRGESQPIGELSCGSVFRNPPGDYAARLIESCGLKGRRIGGAVVSEKHANFILNQSGGLAMDVERLIDYVQESVKKSTGVLLIPEVHVIGEAS
jgi:UDP-N-acetylmuramate dehydrogenase